MDFNNAFLLSFFTYYFIKLAYIKLICHKTNSFLFAQNSKLYLNFIQVNSAHSQLYSRKVRLLVKSLFYVS